MGIIEKIRTTVRKAPLLAWFAFGLLLLAGLLLVFVAVKSEPMVTGTVRLEGELLSDGTIRFVPRKGNSGGSDAGARIRQGKYRIEKGLTPGKYKVEFQAAHRVPGKTARDPITFEVIEAVEPIAFAEFNQSRD